MTNLEIVLLLLVGLMTIPTIIVIRLGYMVFYTDYTQYQFQHFVRSFLMERRNKNKAAN